MERKEEEEGGTQRRREEAKEDDGIRGDGLECPRERGGEELLSDMDALDGRRRREGRRGREEGERGGRRRWRRRRRRSGGGHCRRARHFAVGGCYLPDALFLLYPT